MMNTARTIKRNLTGWGTEACLYELHPPLEGENGRLHTHVIVSTVTGLESVVYGAKVDAPEVDDDCGVLQRFCADHDFKAFFNEEALEKMGYMVNG